MTVVDVVGSAIVFSCERGTLREIIKAKLKRNSGEICESLLTA